MRKIICLMIITVCALTNSFAQKVPAGMKYQAVARNSAGEPLANRSITLRIDLKGDPTNGSLIYYSEEHTITTNQLGLFDLVVGEGTSLSGTFNDVPWSTQDIWMGVSLKDKGADFSAVTESRLLAVPYAFYAASAGQLATNTPKDNSPVQNVASTPGAPGTPCPCEDGLSQIKVLYLGPAPAIIKVYKDKDLHNLITTFSGVANGAILTVNAAIPDGKFQDKTYFQVVNTSIDVAELPTKCEGPNPPPPPEEMGLGETFGNFSILSHLDKKNHAECTVCDIKKDWKVGGNALMDFCNMLGTKSYTDLIFITNNIERLRITKDGNINLANALDIGNDLTVRRNVFLNTTGGATINNGPFTVANVSTSNLSGLLNVDKDTWLKSKLKVDGITDLNNVLNVNNLSPTSLSGILNVDKDTWLKSALKVDGATNLSGGVTIDNASPLNLTGILTVDKDTWLKSKLRVDGTSDLNDSLRVNNAKPTMLTGLLNVDGSTTLNSDLTVTKNSPNFIASFVNTNTGDGDGLLIKLGKTHPAYNGSGYLNVTSPSEVFTPAITTIKGWVFNHTGFNPSQLFTFIPATFQAGLACQVVNMITGRLNDALHLPLQIPAVNMPAVVMPAVILPALSVDLGDPFGSFDIIGQTTIFPSATIFPATTLLPAFTLLPPIPTIDCAALGLPTLSVPNINFTDVSNSLTNNNQFISFVDKDNKELGSIRAQSVNDWRNSYLDETYFVNLMAGMVGIDVVNGVANAISGFTNLAKSYNSIGVEYASGHGDYAEWLERTNPDERISAGDIVGVKGGKVSKNLAGAEQILAVSHDPIVLGNAPSKEKEVFGNKIAFTGQVPVKVVGPVNMGDYIIAKGDIAGYGVAVSPANITTNDLKLAVGRSWETNLGEGPKMVNTLIGVDNGDYIKIMKDSQDKINVMELRVKTLEEKMDKMISGKEKKKPVKKINRRTR